MGTQALIDLHCADGTHDRLKADPAAWGALPLVGYMEGIELRNCACTSTLAIEVSE